MNESTSSSKKLINQFDRMWMDSLLSLQPTGTYREAWNAVTTTDAENTYGISNEPSNELFVDLPGNVRGMVYVEERDQYVVFVSTNAGGEIGIIDEKTRNYRTVTNTSIASELGISEAEWIDAEVKVMQPCNQLYLYWSSNDVYKRINLDDPCCKFEEIPLIKPICIATITTDLLEHGGGLANGIYQFAAKAIDVEGNDSNWSRISNPISISDGDHLAGERSSKAINLRIKVVNNRDYHLVDLAVIKTIDGITSVEKFATVSANSGANVINHVYSGNTGREFPMQLSDILTRTNRYIKGKNLIQYDNRLILYNLRPIHNLDYQRQANKITAKYVIYVVPIEYAHLFKGLRANENYWFAIRWNYSDGTSSVNYIIPGLEGTNGICDPYEDTSERENVYHDLYFEDDDFEVDATTDHSSIELLDDESTSIAEGDLENEGGMEDSMNEAGNEANEANQAANKECVCAAAKKIKDLQSEQPNVNFGTTLAQIGETLSNSNGDLADLSVAFGQLMTAYGALQSSGTWDLDGDVAGAITLEQILCNCEPPPTFNVSFPTTTLNQYTDEPAGVRSDSLDLGRPVDGRPGKTLGTYCNQEGYTTCNNNVCYTCKDGIWQTLLNGDSYNTNGGYSKSSKRGQFNQARGSNVNNTNHSELGFEYDYAEDGCTVIGVKPIRYADGKFGKWQTQEVYPETLNCECEFIYGELAGKNVRLHKVPSVTKEPHFMSFASGVPNKHDMGNSEFKDTYMFMVGVELDNITLPVNPPKPLCKRNPYSITYVERTESNKTVIGSGLGHSCFLGEIAGENYAFPKHALNSFERFDRSIEPNGQTTFRGGGPIDVGAYIVHSPDFHMRRPPLDATECLIELEMYGKGWRHGIMALGEKPEHSSQDRLNQKGTRQSINANHYHKYAHPIVRSVKSMSVAPADSVVSRSNKFTYNLCNLHRESSTYVELDGELEHFAQDTIKYGGRDATPDGASDRSFTGDIFTESMPIHNAKAHYMTFIRRLPNQYGSPINQAYIPLGLEANGFQSKISGLVGDSFIGAMTYKRTAMVSDKTNRLISKFVLRDGLTGTSDGPIARVFGNLLSSIWRVLGLRNGGYIPQTQDPSDHIRVFGGLRYVNDVVSSNPAGFHPGEVSLGNIPDPIFPNHVITARTSTDNDVNHGDNYFPQNLKTQVVSYFNADVNLGYRQLNDVESGELYYSRDSYTLKGLQIDSSMPEDFLWQKAWLNRWYSEWKENAKWKLIIQGVFTFLFTYIIGLWLVFKGISLAVTSLQAAGGGSFGLQTTGALLALVFGILVVAFGIAWIKHWVRSDADNKIIEEYVGLKNIRPDRRNVDGSFSMNENRFRGFEDNYWRYDNTHSLANKWEVSFGMSDPYITCACPTKYHNQILYSNRQTMESQVDTWRNFKPNNNLEIPSEHGQLQKIFRLGNSLYAHTTDMLIELHKGGSGYSVGEGDVLLGTGDLFGIATPIYGGVMEGYAGLLDPNAAQVCIHGYIFPDREARKWYIFSGEMPKPISNMGVKHFMDENMHLLLLDKFPNFKVVDLKLPEGIGFTFGVDHKNNRLLFTKRDYIPLYDNITLNDNCNTFSIDGETISLNNPKYFDNVSFTLSYSLRNDSWVSFHNYVPLFYTWNRFDMYSFENTAMWKHNVKGHFQTFYGQYYPFSIEYIANEKSSGDSFVYISSILGTEAYKWKDTDYIRNNVTFDKLIAYNSHQNSGLKNFISNEDISIIERSTEYHDRVQLDNTDRIWTFSKLSDYLIDDQEFMFENPSIIAPKPVNLNNISESSIKNNKFFDNFFANRLIFSKFDDVKILLKRIETLIDYKSR